VKWVPSVGELHPFTGVHLSNELLDAFPVHVVEWNGTEWLERLVAIDRDEFAFAGGPLSSRQLAVACALIPQPLPSGYVTEVNLEIGAWIREVGEKLEEGYVLAIDYGHLREDYYHPDRVEGTLSAYAAQRREKNPLARPGEVDLTAHVDFTTLIESAGEAGLSVAGYTDQHHFMVGLGADYFAAGASPSELRQFQTLMHPTMLGQVFKAIGFAKGDAPRALAGFRYARAL
jgi:SAM-dependent MidA family methyltransferase